jgi:hypothetical protein
MRRFLLISLVFCLALVGTAEAAKIGIGNAVAVSPTRGHDAAGDTPARAAAGADSRPSPASGGGTANRDGASAHGAGPPSVSASPTVSTPASGAPTPSTPGPSQAEAPTSSALFADSFDQPDGLITNDFSHWSPGNVAATLSPDWEMTSGSLFARGGEAFTGVPDGCEDASPTSSPCTASAVFRLNSTRHDFGDVALSLDVTNDRLVSTTRTPPVAFDGIHLWLRYQSEYELYAVSFNRRDGHIVIKKKCAGGSENGGTYYELGRGELSGFPIPFGQVQHISATARNLPGGAVELTLARDGATLLSAVDEGVGCAPITAPGAIGVRGDNDEFSFDDLAVTAL